MSKPNSSRWHSAVGLLAATTWLASGQASLAAESANATSGQGGSAPSVSANTGTGSAGDSISAAKREFDAVRASRDSVLHGPKGVLPKFAMPELHTSPANAPAAPMAPSDVKPDPRKSANWLVDAMDRERRRGKGSADASAGRMDRATDRRLELDQSDDVLTAFETEHGASARERANDDHDARAASEARDERNRPEPDTNSSLENPLTRYLGEWMTPHDYALLRPGLEESLAGGIGGDRGSGSGNGIAHPGALPIGISSGSETAFGLLGMTKPDFAPAAPRENPFLDAIEIPAPALPGGSPSLPASIVSLPPPAPPVPIAPMPAAAAPAPGKAQIPDFAKPALDDKYFKPLKRF